MSEPTADSLRLRLVEIDDELRSLAPDAFAEKHELLTEGDRHRKMIAELLGSDLDAATSEWAIRASRKGTHTVDEAEMAAKAAIVSSGDGGT